MDRVLADAAAMPMQSYLQHFRGEFDARVVGLGSASASLGVNAQPANTRVRTARDEITPPAKRDAALHGAPGVADVGMGERK
jgi:hypothetical protein